MKIKSQTNDQSEEITLSLGQIQEILDIPQYTLIHLCEKKVIVPDFSDTEGKGKHRLFSRRNLLEFAIAIHIRKFQIPVMATRVIIGVIRGFEEKIRKSLPDFSLFESMKKNAHPELIIYIDEAEHIIFSLQNKKNPLYLKCPLHSINKKTSIRFVALSELPPRRISRLEINISKIIENLSKKLL